MHTCKARYIGSGLIESPDYTGPAVVLEVEIPADQIGNLNKNDTYRREVAAALASAAVQTPQPTAGPVDGLVGR